MKERPILFSTPMIRAILEDRKTQTRRIIKPQPPNTATKAMVIGCPADGKSTIVWTGDSWEDPLSDADFKSRHPKGWKCPYGKPGDRLWVREAWCQVDEKVDPDRPILYRANGTARSLEKIWKPSTHMPRWASRITLEITDIRVERLQDISPESAAAEGIIWGNDIGIGPFELKEKKMPLACHAFAALWDSINAKRGFGWDINPWVWVIEFKRLEMIQGGQDE